MTALVPRRRSTLPLVETPTGWATDDGYTLSIGRGRTSRRLIGELKTPSGETHALAGRTAEGAPDLLAWAEDVIARDRRGELA